MGGISIWQLLIIAAIVILLFGTKKLRGMGGDLGDAIKGFKKAMNDNDDASTTETKNLADPAQKKQADLAADDEKNKQKEQG